MNEQKFAMENEMKQIEIQELIDDAEAQHAVYEQGEMLMLVKVWCPVRIFEKYISLCLHEMLTKAFYLHPQLLQCGITNHQLGTTHLITVKSMMSAAGFKAHYINHSLKSQQLWGYMVVVNQQAGILHVNIPVLKSCGGFSSKYKGHKPPRLDINTPPTKSIDLFILALMTYLLNWSLARHRQCWVMRTKVTYFQLL